MTIIVGQRGVLKWKSTPHSPVGYAIESGMMDEDEAMTHDLENIGDTTLCFTTVEFLDSANAPLM